MPFGGAPCPSKFALAADLTADTINDLISDKNWDNKSVFSDMIHEIPNLIAASDEILFAEVKNLSVEIPTKDCGKTAVYVDDFITIGPDIYDTLEKIIQTPKHQ